MRKVRYDTGTARTKLLMGTAAVLVQVWEVNGQ